MRLWSLHPRYLDTKGLVALWREALLAQAVLLGRTKGYQHHPQLSRFRAAPDPVVAVGAYLTAVQAEATQRGYAFDAGRIVHLGTVEPIPVTAGQMAYEWSHLLKKLQTRAPDRLAGLGGVSSPEPHPLFRVIPGGVEAWEVVGG